MATSVDSLFIDHLDFTVDSSKWGGLGDFVRKIQSQYNQHYIPIVVSSFSYVLSFNSQWEESFAISMLSSSIILPKCSSFISFYHNCRDGHHSPKFTPAILLVTIYIPAWWREAICTVPQELLSRLPRTQLNHQGQYQTQACRPRIPSFDRLASMSSTFVLYFVLVDFFLGNLHLWLLKSWYVILFYIKDPGISSTQPSGSYKPYSDGMSMDVFVKTTDGKPLVGTVGW